MDPQPWSHSRLDNFQTCPRQFEAVHVSKLVKDTMGEAAIWGLEVHKHFEDRLQHGVVLPEDLAGHEPFLAKLEAMPGEMAVEQKIALNKVLEPCGFFDSDVWFRGVIDYLKVDGRVATVIDHKTGKVHGKFAQLKLFALYVFIAYPDVSTITAEYYWTKTKQRSGEIYRRGDIPDLWASFTPALRQYLEAFRSDVWQPRQSGLCAGWCPVRDCEFWRPKRTKY